MRTEPSNNHAVICELAFLFIAGDLYERTNKTRNSLAQYVDNLERASKGLPRRILNFPEGDIPKIKRLCEKEGINTSTDSAVSDNREKIYEIIDRYYRIH